MDKCAPQKLAKTGVFFGLSAYTIWGTFPVFFKLLSDVPPLEIVCHRITWSAIFLITVVAVRRQLGNLWITLQKRTSLITLSASTLLIATNWLVFLFAVQRGEVLQSSLGYFMTPLVSVLLGFLFLKEHLTKWQKISVLLAFLGVLNLSLHQGDFPWIAMLLALSFGLYGLLRKLAKIDAMTGLTIETMLLAPISLGYIILLGHQQQSAFLSGTLQHNLMLPLSGVVTAIPLLLFVGAARRLRLSTVGFLQYITPSMHFFLAVSVYGEPFSRNHFVSFLFIWTALIIYSLNTIRVNTQKHMTYTAGQA